MNDPAALATISGYAAANRVFFSGHALQRMGERNVRRGDVISALVNGQSANSQTNNCYRVTGPDLDGDALDVVVAIESGVVVVTVY
jgi:hypothetical protein